MMTIDQLKNSVPSVFATSPSPSVSDRYVFVPTIDIIESFDKAGWNIASARQTGKGLHSTHEIRFRNGELPKVGDTLFEAIIKNSHNGTATFQVSAGLHRLVCSNGLTVPTSIAQSMKVRHMSFDIDDVKRLTDSFAGQLPMIESSVTKMMETTLTTEQKIDFVRRSSEIRFGDKKVLNEMEILGLLTPNRTEDDGDSMWQVFNTLQEKYIRGGVEMTTMSGRRTKLRGLQNIMATNKINLELWNLAEEMI